MERILDGAFIGPTVRGGAFSDFLRKLPYEEAPLYAPDRPGAGDSSSADEGRGFEEGSYPLISLCQLVFVASLAEVRVRVSEVYVRATGSSSLVGFLVRGSLVTRVFLLRFRRFLRDRFGESVSEADV